MIKWIHLAVLVILLLLSTPAFAGLLGGDTYLIVKKTGDSNSTDFNKLYNFPVPCAAGYAISAIDHNVFTCVAVGGLTNPITEDLNIGLTYDSTNFSKSDYGSEQDCFDNNVVCLTRGDNQGLYNATYEGSFVEDTSPIFTEWSKGLCANANSFGVWDTTVSPARYGSSSAMLVDSQCLHVIDASNLYFDIKFTSWTSGNKGGGFAYKRTPYYGKNSLRVSGDVNASKFCFNSGSCATNWTNFTSLFVEDVYIQNLINGRIPFTNNGKLSDDSNLQWDNTNKKLLVDLNRNFCSGTNIVTMSGIYLTCQPPPSPPLPPNTDCWGQMFGSKHKICSANDLNKVDTNATTLGWGYILDQNIDFSTADASYSTGLGWRPIGTSAARFSGTFDGNSKVIKNLFINRPDENFVGLFGFVNSAILDINNLGMVDSNITGFCYVGGISGINGRINNSYNTGTINSTGTYTGGINGNQGIVSDSYNTGNVNGTSYTGGISGINGTSNNSYNTGNVNGTSYTGGLVGGNGIVSNSHNIGTINGTNYVGGLVGITAVVSNSYNTGTITGTGNYTGGINGYLGTVNNSYNTGRINGNDAIGGISGHTGTVKNSYNSGNVTGKDYIGGVNGRGGTVTNSYNTGTIRSATGNFTGGVIGYSGTIYNSFSIGTIQQTGGSKGGINGSVGTLTNAYWYDSNLSDSATTCIDVGDTNCTKLSDSNYSLLYDSSTDLYDTNTPVWNDGNWVWHADTYPTLAWQTDSNETPPTPPSITGFVWFNDADGNHTTDSNLFWNNNTHRLGIGTQTPNYPFEIDSNVSGISAYFDGNIIARGYNTLTTVYDKSLGTALSKIKDANQYLNPTGTVNDALFGYSSITFPKNVIDHYITGTAYQTQTTTTITYIDTKTGKIIDEKIALEMNPEDYNTIITTNTIKVPVEIKTPVYKTVQQTGVSLDKEIALIKQALYELKNCVQTGKDLIEVKACVEK